MILQISSWFTTALTIVGPLAGAFGWYVTVRLNRAASRSQHTFDVMLTTALDSAYQKHLSIARPRFVKSGNSGFPALHDSKNRKLQLSVLFLLNYYEFLAGAVRHGILTESLMREDQGYIVRQLFVHAKKYIEKDRILKKRPALFEHFEWLYDRWNRRKISRVQKIVEWIFNRPLYNS